ncbi:MAG: hypothetical protein U0Q14_12650 [Dermatophilaceae bacterium]
MPARPNVDIGDHEIAPRNEILRTEVGSGVHGMAIAGTDDRSRAVSAVSRAIRAR